MSTRMAASLIDAVENGCHFHHPFHGRVVALAGSEAARPVGGRTSTPRVRRSAQCFATRSLEALGDEVQERAVHVPKGGTTLCSVERCADLSVAADGQVPRTGDSR